MFGFLKEILGLFFPEQCPACRRPLPEGADFLCPDCRWDIPLTEYCHEHDNPVFRMFDGLVPCEEAASLFLFHGHSRFRDMVHGFKYYGQWRTARRLGEWLGRELKASGLYEGIDLVIPIPLHTRKFIRRGYNQSEYIAEGVASVLGAAVDRRSVVRRKYNKSQALSKHKHDRWDNVAGIFGVRSPEALEGKRVLLLDDVLTTGATIASCAEAMLAAAPGCRISIATLAVSGTEIKKRGEI